jgi:hypothetical protein
VESREEIAVRRSQAARELGRAARLYSEEPLEAYAILRAAYHDALSAGLSAQSIHEVSGHSPAELDKLLGVGAPPKPADAPTPE